MKSNKKKNLKINKGFRFNNGVLIFLLILIYVVVILVINSKSTSIVGYQVKNGKLSENRIYSGIALREEFPVLCEDTGNIALFVKEGERIAYNNLVYAIDKTGKFSDLTEKDPGLEDTSLSSAELNALKQEMMLFSRDFDETCFSDVKIFEKQITEEMDRLESKELLAGIDEINSSHLADVVKFFYSNNTGIISYYKDGFEMKTADMLVEDDFDEEKYEPVYTSNDLYVEQGSFIYKFSNAENWSVCILVPNEELHRLIEDDYIKVKFLRSQTTSWGQVHIAKHLEKNAIVELKFTNSMVSFAKDRFVEVELLLEEDTGLKVPNTAIANNTFFLIDNAYITRGGYSGEYGVNRKVINNNGDVTTKFTTVNIYKQTDTETYVSMSELSIGDVLYYVENGSNISEDSPSQTFTVGKQGTLTGVYNINKGYADFKRIEVLYANDQYSIIEPDTPSGLKAYDYIALDASVVTDKDFVY